MITVGTLLEFTITRALPDHEAYLVMLFPDGIPALLPKKYSIKQYQLGESGWATVFNTEKTYLILSQRAPQYTRKILEYLINDELQASDLRIFRVAKTENGRQYKVAVKGSGRPEDLSARIRDMKELISKYIYGNIFFVKYVRNPVEYTKNALLPAPKDKIRRVIQQEEIKQMNVYVDTAAVALFYGTKGNNVAAACKLTGYTIKIIAA